MCFVHTLVIKLLSEGMSLLFREIAFCCNTFLHFECEEEGD